MRATQHARTSTEVRSCVQGRCPSSAPRPCSAEQQTPWFRVARSSWTGYPGATSPVLLRCATELARFTLSAQGTNLEQGAPDRDTRSAPKRGRPRCSRLSAKPRRLRHSPRRLRRRGLARCKLDRLAKALAICMNARIGSVNRAWPSRRCRESADRACGSRRTANERSDHLLAPSTSRVPSRDSRL